MTELDFPTRRLFGIPIAAATMSQALALCRDAMAARRQLVIGVVNAAKIVNMRRQPLLRESVLSADVVFADGMAVVWASRLCRRPLPERVAGIDLFTALVAMAAEEGRRVYFLGAKQEILDEMIRRLREQFPKLQVAGARNGYFDDDDADAIADAINASGVDMLFLGMSSPKKEIFLARQGPRLTARICHGVGGSFDVVAGHVRRAPRGWQRLGLEWLYRLLQEPGRMWRRYLVTNTWFVALTVREMFRRTPSVPGNSPSPAQSPPAQSPPAQSPPAS
jgi:N-acetylglucosaminyldiphosphoundecaprenol N-acetyl-beta-D-mannosaminyltransferase